MTGPVYKQCKLRKQHTNEEQIAFLPTQFAQEGKYLRIGLADGWRVLKVYQAPVPHEALMEVANSYRHTRKASDV